jgi:hypothetical protein
MNRPVQFIKVGGPFTAKQLTLIDQLGMKSQIRHLGRVSFAEFPNMYIMADLLLMPSFYEGFGLPALEAIACRTPVVVWNQRSLPEVVATPAFWLSQYRSRPSQTASCVCLQTSIARRFARASPRAGSPPNSVGNPPRRGTLTAYRAVTDKAWRSGERTRLPGPRVERQSVCPPDGIGLEKLMRAAEREHSSRLLDVLYYALHRGFWPFLRGLT